MRQKNKDHDDPAKRVGGFGWSISAFSRKTGFSYRMICRAIAVGELETATFAGTTRIKEGELKRLANMFGGLALLDDESEKAVKH